MQIKELVDRQLIEIIDNDYYKISIINLYKGNSWTIIQQMQTNYMRKH